MMNLTENTAYMNTSAVQRMMRRFNRDQQVYNALCAASTPKRVHELGIKYSTIQAVTASLRRLRQAGLVKAYTDPNEVEFVEMPNGMYRKCTITRYSLA